MKEKNIPYDAKIGTVLITVVVAIAAMTGGSICMPSALGLLLLAVGGGFLGYAYLLTYNPLVFSAAPVTYGIVWLWTKSFVTPLSLLIAVGAAVALGLFSRTAITKSQLVVRVMVAMGIGGAIWFLTKFAVANGVPTPEAIKRVFGDYVTSWKQLGYELVQAVRERLSEEVLSWYGTFLTTDVVDSVVELISSMLLGAAVILLEGAAYLSVAFLRCLLRLFKTPLLGAAPPFILVVSKVSAVIYTLSYALSFFMTIREESGIFGTVLMNLVMILAPGLFITGLNMLKALLSSPILRKIRIGVFIFGGITLLIAPGVLLSLIIFMGIWGAITAKRIQRN